MESNTINFGFIEVTFLLVMEKLISKDKIPEFIVAWTPSKENMPESYKKYKNPICIRENFSNLLTKEELMAVLKHEALHLSLKQNPSWDIKSKRHIEEVFEKNESEVDNNLSKEELNLIQKAKEKYLIFCQRKNGK